MIPFESRWLTKKLLHSCKLKWKLKRFLYFYQSLLSLYIFPFILSSTFAKSSWLFELLLLLAYNKFKYSLYDKSLLYFPLSNHWVRFSFLGEQRRMYSFRIFLFHRQLKSLLFISIFSLFLFMKLYKTKVYSHVTISTYWIVLETSAKTILTAKHKVLKMKDPF